MKEGREIRELIQVCYDIGDYDTRKREVNALLKSGKELKCRRLIVISDDYEAEATIEGRKIRFIPLWKRLLE